LSGVGEGMVESLVQGVMLAEAREQEALRFRQSRGGSQRA
jgi:hypothetical protein